MGTLVFEILTEEIPAQEQPRIEEHWNAVTPARLKELRLSFGSVDVYVTPHRSVLVVSDLADRQEDVTEKVWGPPADIAFREGRPTRALEGFARKTGISPENVDIAEKDGRKYVVVERFHEGRPAVEVLGELAYALVSGIPFKKTMVWNSSKARFSRPVRSILFMLDSEDVPFGWAGLNSGRTLHAHRFMKDFLRHEGGGNLLRDAACEINDVDKKSVISMGYKESVCRWELSEASHYLPLARSLGGVVPSLEARKSAILKALYGAAEARGLRLVEDDGLLEETARLTELPVVVMGSFSEDFLAVPEEVLLTSMKKHQRYFAFRRQDGSLAPVFAAVSAMVPRDETIVREGFERVLVARLSDARFFWEEDRNRPLSDNIEHMKTMVYHRKLGTLWEKIERMSALSLEFAPVVQADSDKVKRAALLAKLDLETQMVYEFPELQGLMGMYYAREQGEDPEVAEAIFEHYLPRHASDDVPSTATGTAVALADRLDTMVCGIGAGLKPSGSSDAFGIRRAALTFLRILLVKGIHISLSEWVGKAARLSPVEVSEEEVLSFVADRLRAYLSESRPKELVDAVMAAGWDDPADVLARVEAIQTSLGTETFAALVRLFKRFNILKKLDEIPDSVDPDLLVAPAEKELYSAIQSVAGEVIHLVNERKYEKALERLTPLWEPVDTFFDSQRGVRVMADDPALRSNRAALLYRLDALFRQIADFKAMAGLV